MTRGSANRTRNWRNPPSGGRLPRRWLKGCATRSIISICNCARSRRIWRRKSCWQLRLPEESMSSSNTTGVRPATVGEGLAVVSVVLLLPIALYAAHLAAIERLLYPASNLALALYLFARRSAWYTGQIVLIFCFVSLVRRLVDAQIGFDAQSPVLLTPYLCGALAGMEFLNYWLRPQPRHIGPYLIILLAVTYGAKLAIGGGRILAALSDTLKWGLGPKNTKNNHTQNSSQALTRKVVEHCLV